MRYRKHIVLVVGLTLLSLCAAASAEKDIASVRAYIDKKAIFIGDRIRYAIEIDSGYDLDTEIPKFFDESAKSGKIGDFEVKGYKARHKKSFLGKHKFTNLYEITIYSTGKQSIPSVEIRYRRKGEKNWLTRKTDPIPITVESVLARETKAQDIRDIKGPKSFYEINWVLVLIILAIPALILSGIIVYRRKKRIVPVKLPHETALEELEAIREVLFQKGDIKEYYVRISDCVRHYIERVFALKAPEMTTEEFLESLKGSSKLPFDNKDSLKAFLEACDLVKFAKYAPTRQEIESVYVTAKRFVQGGRKVNSVYV